MTPFPNLRAGVKRTAAEMMQNQDSVDMSSEPQTWRVVGPSQDQWNSIKAEFTRLYIDENRKLKEVREIMAKKHGFNASEKMFKRRITEWKICKNYKAKDKVALAKRVKALVEAGQDIQSISFKGRPAKLDRVKRHCRTDKRFAQLWENIMNPDDDVSVDEQAVASHSISPVLTSVTSARAPTWSTVSDSLDYQVQNSREASISVPTSNAVEPLDPVSMNNTMSIYIPPPTDFKTVESTFFHTQAAIEWQFTAFKPLSVKQLNLRYPGTITKEVLAGQLDQSSAFWLSLFHGFQHVKSQKFQEGFHEISIASSMVQPLIVSAPIHLLSCLLLHFATSWQELNAIEQHLLNYVSAMATKMLGAHHPLSNALSMIATANVRDHAVEGMMDLVIKGYSARRKTDSSSLFALRVDQVDMLRKRRNFTQAQALCMKLVDDSLSMRGKRYRTALASLGRIYEDQNQEFAVEGVAHRILEHEASDRSKSNSGGTSSWACEQLASLAMKRGDFARAESYLRRAIYLSHQRYPHRGPSTMSFVEKLDVCLKAQGRQETVGEACKVMGVNLDKVRG